MPGRAVEAARPIAETVAGVLTLGALFSFIPAITGVLAAIWYALRIWESETVKHWRNRK